MADETMATRWTGRWLGLSRDDPIIVTISTQRKTVMNPDELLKDLNTHQHITMLRF